MGHHAAFWDNPEAGDDTPVIRHAPDKANYHLPDKEQLAHMPRLRGVQAVVPAARPDGRSMGFDHESPGVVHVDPDAPDGGAIVDLAAVGKHDLNAALYASVYPHQVFYKLGARPRLRDGFVTASEPERANPVMPNAYIVPRATEGGLQLGPAARQAQEEHAMTQPLSMPPAQPQLQPGQPQPAPQPAAYQPQYSPQPMMNQPALLSPPQMDPAMQAALLQLTQTVQGLTAQVSQMRQERQREAPRPARAPQLATQPVEIAGRQPPELYPIGAAPRRRDDGDGVFSDEATPIGAGARRRRDRDDDEEEDNSLVRREHRKKQRLRDYQDAEADPANAVIAGFETLEMNFVTGPLPEKARRQVFFEFEGLGKQATRYHDVVESEHCVALVYDTRYKDGTQFLPPDLLDKHLLLHVPHLKKTFTVSSMGFAFACGVLDFIVLVKHAVSEIHPAD